MRDDITLHEAIAVALVLDVELVDLIGGEAEIWASVRLGQHSMSPYALRQMLTTNHAGLTRYQVRQAEAARKFLDSMIGDREDEGA
jgi:hypothetical protein